MTTTAAMNDAHQSLDDRLLEMFDALCDDFVDPQDAYTDVDGDWWLPVGSVGASTATRGAGPLSEGGLRELRNQCRRLAAANEFAINGHENRISYAVGSGHSYHATVCKGMEGSAELAMQVQKLLDRFGDENRWHQRQQEIVRRMDRDGEAFLRFFAGPDGMTCVRFIEPDQVTTPESRSTDPSTSFGIQTDAHDVETVLGYYVDGELVDAGDVQHRRANVDLNVKRGLPLYTPVRKNLRRAEKLLRNMSVVAEIQSAIALIRKHRSAARSGVEQFVASQSDATGFDTMSGRTRRLSHYAPGTILDAPDGLDYDFPAQGIDASSFVLVLQAELRAVASRLVMPEFMFTSDASNSNYASTLVAEGPAVKMFERLQANLKNEDRNVMWRVIENAVAQGRLHPDTRRMVDIQVTPPSLRVRDQMKDCQVEKVAYDKGLLSPQTWSLRLGLDYDQEQKNLAMHRQEVGDQRSEVGDK